MKKWISEASNRATNGWIKKLTTQLSREKNQVICSQSQYKIHKNAFVKFRLFSLWRRDWKGGSDSLWNHGSVPSATPRPALALSSPSPASLLRHLPCFPSAFSQDQIHGLSALRVITNQWQWAWLLGFLGHSFSPDAWPLTASSLSKGWDLGQPLCLDYFRRAQFQKTSLSIAKV